MHGCVTSPEDIVITEADYESYFLHSKSKPLGSLVQANLMTSHFLFVGFGMADKNYTTLLSEVKEALSPNGGGGGGGGGVGGGGGSGGGGGGGIELEKLGMATTLSIDCWPQSASLSPRLTHVNQVCMCYCVFVRVTHHRHCYYQHVV